AITFLMAAVFIPVAFMSGPVGIFYRQFSITMATSIILSGVVALTLTPALCAIMLQSNHGKARKQSAVDRFLEAFNRLFDKMSNKYVYLLKGIVDKRLLTFVVLISFCIGAYFLNNSVP